MESILQKQEANDYGEQFQNHLLEIYKLYVNTAEKISDRRQSANSFFLSVNTAIMAVIGYILGLTNGEATKGFYWWLILITLAGIIICYAWFRLIQSYKQMNLGKFSVIHNIEKLLPISPFIAEWKALGEGKDSKKYLLFTKVEQKVPWAFLLMHIVAFITAVIKVSGCKTLF
ncbi:MAG: hypothetical protein JRJ44_07060 [Deltaproteobacteria bacterium]|nr:hypothetical protein [Deltaproteobacteria bacterium]